MDLHNKSASHAVYAIRLHIVFVTKYRRPALNDEMIADLKEAFAHILSEWRCTLLEFGAEADHVHLLTDIHPALNLSTLINNLKSAVPSGSAENTGTGFATFMTSQCSGIAPITWARSAMRHWRR